MIEYLVVFNIISRETRDTFVKKSLTFGRLSDTIYIGELSLIYCLLY